MSRSPRAWIENCGSASTVLGVGEQDKPQQQAHLGRGPLLGAVSSIKCLLQLLFVALLIAATTPATALADSASGGQAKSQTSKTQPQPTHPQPAGAAMLALGSGYSSLDGAAPVRVLQRHLATTGFSPGPIDGRYGPLTEQAVERFQASHALQVDGIAGPLTLTALRNPSIALYPGAGYTGSGSGRVRALQRSLAKAGFSPGPIDGRYGPLTEHAVARFQATHGLGANGIAGPRTFVALGHKATLPSRQVGSHQRANRPSRQRPARPVVSQRPGRVSAPQKTMPATHATSSPPVALVVLLIALVVALALAAVWFAHRRRTRRYAAVDAASNGAVDAATNGASHGDSADAIAAHVNNTTPTPTPTPDQTPTPDPAEPTADDAFSNALLLEARGDQEGAIAAYERADQLGHAAAAANLGVLLEQQGEQTAAEASYRRADRRGDANGAFNLAVLLEERGDHAGALRAYQRADQLGHAAAAANLGVLLEQQGEQTAAEASYRRADQRGDANGAFNLAVLLEERGDHAGALHAYSRAGQLGHPEIAEMARAAAVQLANHQRPTTAGARGGHNGS